MDQFIEVLLDGVMAAIKDRIETSDGGIKMDAAGKMAGLQGEDSEEMPNNLKSEERLQFHPAGKRPAVQGGDSVENMEMEMPNNRVSDEGLQFHPAGKRPAVQGGDSVENMEMEMPNNLKSEERLQFHPAGKRPAVQGGDSVENMEMEMLSNRVSDEGLQLHEGGQRSLYAVMRYEMRQILMQPGDLREKLAKLLQYVEENQRQNQENQPLTQLQILMQSMLSYTEKEVLAKLLKNGEENQLQKQENQPRKQNKKHHRKGRMALRKITMDKLKKSQLDPPRTEAAYLACRAKEKESEAGSESRTDWHAYQARLCRDRWNKSFLAAGHYGTYETITPIPPMRFTDSADASAGPRETLQIFSVKVVGTKEGVHWPLYVYGTLAVRDTVDHRRNIIFDRKRDSFQTVTKEYPYLTLTGPSRAAVLSVRHSYIEAELKIKGSSSDSDDKDFSYLASGYIQTAPCESFITKRVMSSRLSTLELTAGHIANSVEATVSVEVRSGEWPSGYEGVFMVSTVSMDAMKIVLLSFGDDGLPLEDDGKTISLSRRVVGVEIGGRLRVTVKALLPGDSNKDVLSDEPSSKGVFRDGPGDSSKDVLNDEPGGSSKDVLSDEPSGSRKDLLSIEPSSKDVFRDVPGDSSKDVLNDEPGGSSKDVLSDEPSGSSKDLLSIEPSSKDVLSDEPGGSSKDVLSDEPGGSVKDVLSIEPSSKDVPGGSVKDVLSIEPSSKDVLSDEPGGSSKDVMSAVKLFEPKKSGRSRHVLSAVKLFQPKKSGRSSHKLKVGSCEIEVTVAWSLLLTYDYEY